MRRVPRFNRMCEFCGGEFLVTPQRAKKRFCDVVCAGKARSGSANCNFNGGLCRHNALGRWLIVCRDGSLVYFYRAVMEAELRRPLEADEVVHHVNGDSSDDRPENLRVLSRSEHARLHREEQAA